MDYSRGNILFLILIGVALFGALAYAVTQGSRGGGKGDISDEQADIIASQVIENAEDIASAVTRLQIVRGCGDDEFDFANDQHVLFSDDSPIFLENHNSNAPTNGRCSIFKPEGGGIIAKILPEGAAIKNQSVGVNKARSGGVSGIVIDGVGSSQRDLVWLYPNLEESVCIKINQKLGIDNPSSVPPVDAPAGSVPAYDGTYSGAAVIGDNASEIYGKVAFCVRLTSAAPEDHELAFLRVLIAR